MINFCFTTFHQIISIIIYSKIDMRVNKLYTILTGIKKTAFFVLDKRLLNILDINKINKIII